MIFSTFSVTPQEKKIMKGRNYMKKMMLAGLLLAMSSIAMADSAQDVLKKARDDYYKQQEAEKKAARTPKKVEKAER